MLAKRQHNNSLTLATNLAAAHVSQGTLTKILSTTKPSQMLPLMVITDQDM